MGRKSREKAARHRAAAVERAVQAQVSGGWLSAALPETPILTPEVTAADVKPAGGEVREVDDLDDGPPDGYDGGPVRGDLPPMPDTVKLLPTARGYPVPWFVAWMKGKPEFRVADARKMVTAVNERRCWVCGQHMTGLMAFIVGPMCTVTRTTAEPPCHPDCAEYSVKACPFLAKPQMVRRENDLPEGIGCAGEMIERNPGCVAIWTVAGYKIFPDPGSGGALFHIGDPLGPVSWWAEGRAATRQEVNRAVDSGIPLLYQMDPTPEAAVALRRMLAAALKFFPVELIVPG